MPKRAVRDPRYRGRRFSPDTIELCVRWYITYRLSYRDLVAMMAESGVIVSHTTIMRWVLRYVPEYERRWARFARSPGLSWRMDETAVAVRGGRHYLYRAVDRRGKSVASCVFRVSRATISRDAGPPVSRHAGLRDGTMMTVSQRVVSGQWVGGRCSGWGTRRLRMDSPFRVSRYALCTSRSRMASARVGSPK